MSNKYLYHIIALTKLVLWLGILLLVYLTINVYEDPIVGIWLGFLWLFIASRWLSFFIFFEIQSLVYKLRTRNQIVAESYKLSLLFGIYAMINVSMILLWQRTKLLGILLLLWFVWLQILLFSKSNKPSENW